MTWSYLTILLCFYAFIKEIKVAEPFIFKYQTEVLNIENAQLNGEVYPYFTYSYLVFSIPIFLLTDLLLYKPTMIVEMIGQIVFRSTLNFGVSVFSQQIGQITYALATSSEIGFFAYIYARLEKDQHRKLTSWTRAATMGGRTFGYFMCQTIILTRIGDYVTLIRIALVFPCVVFLISLFLPRVRWKKMAKRLSEVNGSGEPRSTQGQMTESCTIPTTYSAYLKGRLYKMTSEVIKIYKIGHIRKWSLWWALTTCMSLQVSQYAQAIWGEVQHGAYNPFNGFAEAAYTATAATAILVMSLIRIDWDRWGEITLVLISIIDASCLLINAQTESIYVMYGCYIGYRSLFQVMITIAQYNLAQKMVGESYGLVFGLNSFLALVLQTILTVIVSDKRGLSLPPRQQVLF
ncbi:unnamed protein product [Enterobius vermicularis]|uniref:Thiamine transporter 2 n=1 Tax=Enterobius vermicularis TaxID=51028 RepID=A0A0N4UYJ9_ENTVE|nr:unnamed protein product [Enterobius vermicularis]